MSPDPGDVFKFVSLRSVQLASDEVKRQGTIRDERSDTPEALSRLLAFARKIDSRQAALEHWAQLDRGSLTPLAAAQRKLVERYRQNAAGQNAGQEPPRGSDLLGELGVEQTAAKDTALWAKAWDALYTAHASGPDAGARLETPTGALRLLHYAASLADEPSPAPADALALLSAKPAISPDLDAALRPPGKPPARAAEPPAEQPAGESPGATRAKQLASELQSARQLLESLRTPAVTRPVVQSAPAETSGKWSRQRLSASTTPTLRAALGPDVTHGQAAVLDRLGVAPTTPVTAAAQMLERHVAELGDQALALAKDPEFQAGLMELGKQGKLPFPVPFPFPKPAPATPPDPSTAPDVDVHGRIKPLGIGDLKVVKQTLLAYEPGEVAYIENVLKGESKSRVYRTLDRTETTLMTSEEDVRDTERDTQATDRFELKREADQTIKEDMSIKAGLSVTASYGPIVATASGDFAYSTSKEDSEKASTNFAHEVVDRSITKVQSKIVTQRTTNRINEAEETNTHALDNHAGTEHVVGIYRWVDKRYEAQVYNYGVRMMLEFVVPEPAAFYRAAHASPQVKVDATPPVPFLNDLTPLQPQGAAKTLTAQDIDERNYQAYAARYGASGIGPPPPLQKSIAAAMSDDNLDDGKSIAMTSKDFVVPDGYELSYYEVAMSVLWVNYPKFTAQVSGYIYELLNDTSGGNSQLEVEKAASGSSQGAVDGLVPLSVSAYDVHAFALNVQGYCTRTEDALNAWKLQTYEKIQSAYRALQEAYDQKVSQAHAADATSIQGQNPALNQTLVQTELKKLCITMMTGQHFSQFHAVTDPSDAPTHIPEVEVDEALREGPIVQFFEQAFEWEQMTYLFYPYFWGRKSKWVDTIAIGDPDPSFAQFLTAGSCRVVVPVPVAYVEAVLYMLQSPAADLGEKVWSGGEPPTLESDLYVSLAQEVRNQTDDLAGATPEGDPWEYTLPTTLVWLQPDSALPTFP